MSRDLINPELMRELEERAKKRIVELDQNKIAQYGINRYRFMNNQKIVLFHLGKESKSSGKHEME